MSQTFSLVCHDTKKKLWVGQGWGQMTTFYSGDAKVMALLANFLKTHESKPLFLLCDERNDLYEYEECGNLPEI